MEYLIPEFLLDAHRAKIYIQRRNSTNVYFSLPDPQTGCENSRLGSRVSSFAVVQRILLTIRQIVDRRRKRLTFQPHQIVFLDSQLHIVVGLHNHGRRHHDLRVWTRQRNRYDGVRIRDLFGRSNLQFEPIALGRCARKQRNLQLPRMQWVEGLVVYQRRRRSRLYLPARHAHRDGRRNSAA